MTSSDPLTYPSLNAKILQDTMSSHVEWQVLGGLPYIVRDLHDANDLYRNDPIYFRVGVALSFQTYTSECDKIR